MRLAPLLLLAVSCAATSERIRGPDGLEWVSIDCKHSQTACYREAGEQCPHGYIIGDASGQAGQVTSVYANQYGGSGYSMPVYHGTLMIRCRSGEEPKAVSIAPPPAAPAPPEAKDPSICTHDYDVVGAVAERLAHQTDRAPLDAPPSRQLFVGVCEGLPEEMQLCLNPEYWLRKAGACAATLNNLPARQRALLDALFFVPRN